MSKDKSKKWVISAPLFYNYAGILEFHKKFTQEICLEILEFLGFFCDSSDEI
ncbi:MAG: hypothetical protein SPG65_02030 [Campylobacter sp.]|nr:hypothetical protein [Campylobacter sp.]